MGIPNTYHVDRNLKPHNIKINLYSINRESNLGEIRHFVNAILRVKFSGVNELTFSVPYDISPKSKKIDNPIANRIRTDFKIKIQYGDIVEWFTITKRTKESSSSGDFISLQCHSLAYELSFQYMTDYEAKSYNCLQVLTDCLKGTNWNVGYINQDFLSQYRQFDVSSQTKLSFVDDICETFKAVVLYDTVNRKVNIYKEDEVSSYKGFTIGFGQYLQSIGDELDTNSLKTRLKVAHNGEAGINSANPTGQDYIDDFSVYLYPFERDENRNVIKESMFISNKLCHAILDYNQLINQHTNTFSRLLENKKMLRSQMTELENDLQILKDEMAIVSDDVALLKKLGQPSNEMNGTRHVTQLRINTKNLEIASVKELMDEIDVRIKNLNETLKFENNFKGELLAEMNNIIKVENWSDNNQIDDESYYFAAVDQLSELAILPINMTLDIINFFEVVSEYRNWKRLSVGDIIRIKHDKLGINVQTKVTEMEFNFDSKSISLTISNTKRPENELAKLKRALYRSEKMNTEVKHRMRSLISAANNFNERNDRIADIPDNPTITGFTHKLNDNGSIDLTVNWDYPDFNVTGNNEHNIDGFMLYLHSDTTSDQHIFGSRYEEASRFNANYSSRTFTFSSLAANLFYTIGIEAYRRVDEDIDKSGILFSAIISNDPPYRPVETVTVNAQVNGSINGTYLYTAKNKPENEAMLGQNAIIVDTENKTLLIKNETDAEPGTVSVGDASSVSGKYLGATPLPNTIPVRNKDSKIEGSITGDAASIGGKTIENIVTTEKMGMPNGLATLDQSGKIPLTQLPTGSGGGVSPISSNVRTGIYYGTGEMSREFDLGFEPKTVKIYPANELESTLFLVSREGAFIMESTSPNVYLKGVNGSPASQYGRISLIGFKTGDTESTFGNKANTAYYYEAFM